MKDCDFAFYSDVGGRKNNEDFCLAKKTRKGYLFLVADGLGGHADGSIAAQTAAEAVRDYFSREEKADMLSAVAFAQERVLEQQERYRSKMKTTIAAAYLTEENVQIAHVGDSRVYALKNGKIQFQTTDHSASQLAVNVGEITPEEIRGHVDRNVLTRALGASDTFKVDASTLSSKQFDALLLCTDGFWEYVSEAEMETLYSEGKSAERWLYRMRLLQLERSPQNGDNNTAITVVR